MALHRDESGAVMVVAVAFSIVLIGMVWAVIGMGTRIRMRENLQSSADAAAFSAAVIKAKGLNLIAFLNLILAAVVGMVVLAQLLPWAALFAALELTGLCICDAWFCSCGCWACSHVFDAWSAYGNIQGAASDVVDAGRDLGEIITQAQDIIDAGAFVGANLIANNVGQNEIYGPGIATIPWPLIYQSPDNHFLPLERVDSDELCERAVGFPSGYAWAMMVGALYSDDPVVHGMILGNLATFTLVFGNMLCHSEQDDESMQPLELVEDWEANSHIRTFSVRGDPRQDERRQAVQVAAQGRGGGVQIPGLLMFAQSRFANAQNHDRAERMYNMDWRAHMVRFRFTDGAATYAGGITNPLVGTLLSQIPGPIAQVFGANNTWEGIQDAFILH